jgi:hypothetical protein
MVEHVALPIGGEALLVRQLADRAGQAKRLNWQAVGGSADQRRALAEDLASAREMAFSRLSLATAQTAPSQLLASLSRLFSFARVQPSVLFFDEADALFGKRVRLTAEQQRIARYFASSISRLPGISVLGLSSEPNAAADNFSTLRVALPKAAVRPIAEDELLPSHRFALSIEGEEFGCCSISPVSLEGGLLSGAGFDTLRSDPFVKPPPDEELSRWPTLVVRRALGESRYWFDWRRAVLAGKPDQRSLELHQLDPTGERITHRWRLSGCWPKRWSGPLYDASQAGVSCEELELYYRSVDWL